MREDKQGRSPSILIVDDVPTNLQVLSSMLKERGYEARPVPNAKLALQAAVNDPPDLILLDITMPEMSGYDLCQRLKADPKLAEVPVIFISGSTGALDKIKAFGVGGADYVTKPFRFEEVQARVATHLKLRQLKLDLSERDQELHASLSQLSRLEATRDSLVHAIAHEVRAPLSEICMSLDSVVSSGTQGVSTQVLADLGQIRAACANMVRRLDSVLEVEPLATRELKPYRSE
jgi:PleD family two-component response regulator